ncbi:MAG TPA: acireductone dioxygenase, partial [Delftia acidovorans]|nr:acireductone dioxygenase [Delftia acidovorans]
MGSLVSHRVSDADFVAAIGVQWQHRPLAPEPGLAALLAQA